MTEGAGTVRHFDQYEFTGILMPGAAALFGIVFLFPGVFGTEASNKISFGGFGLFVVLACVLGHLVQAIGNILENVWWKAWGGLPSDWLRTKPDRLLAAGQIERLHELMHQRLGMKPFTMGKLTSHEWYAVTRQIFADVAGASRAERVGIFNGNYGLNRGLAAALLLVGIAAIAADPARYDIAMMAALAAGLAAYRMHRFARHYARELFVQFLQLPPAADAKATTRDITE